ncbi:hypothetical protein ACS0TY_004662 [Phlomoides rotata]
MKTWLHQWARYFPVPRWGARLKIAIGAARGIAHIHKQCGGKLAHGNITSSNIFLNSQQYGLVSDFGLSGIMRISGEQGCLVLGFESTMQAIDQDKE